MILGKKTNYDFYEKTKTMTIFEIHCTAIDDEMDKMK